MEWEKVNVLLGLLLVGMVGFSFFTVAPSFSEKPLEEQRMEFISERDGITGSLMPHGDYRCCLEKPCTYCIEKTPGHGEGATCDCLEDVVLGRHPCGECIGEILEGHGNPYLSRYFARAIAEEVGEQHINTLRQIVYEKYGTPIDEQY